MRHVGKIKNIDSFYFGNQFQYTLSLALRKCV